MAEAGDAAVMTGQMVDAVSHMAMSMRTSPSLHSAVLFAASNVGEPLAARLRKLVVDVELRRFESLEQALGDLAADYGAGSEELRRALQSLRAAELQATQDGLERCLDRATGAVFEGARRRFSEFSDSLQRPVFVLFSIGVVLPLMVGSMLPLMSAGGLGAGPWLAVVLMDVAFPLAFLWAGRRILARRPLVRGGAGGGRRRSPSASRSTSRALGALAVGGALVVVGILCGALADDSAEARSELDSALADGSIASMDGQARAALESRASAASSGPIASLAASLGYLPVLWGVAAAVAAYHLPALREDRRRRAEVRRVEDALPDALFQMGSAVADGAPLEGAMRRAADSSDGPLSRLLSRAIAHITLKRASATEALFGREGALAGYPSEHVSASLKTVVEMARKDVSGAGRAIVSIADHLGDLRRLDREIGSKLRSVTDMMQTTATLFAPVILGVTTALYLVVARLAPSLPFSSVAAAAVPMSAGAFSLVLGVFVLALAALTMHFTSSLANGGDPAEGRYQAARAMPVAICVYTAATVAGQALIA